MIKSIIQFAAPPAVQPRWDGWLRRRDKLSVAKASGAFSWASGGTTRLSVPAAYAVVVVLIVISGVVAARLPALQGGRRRYCGLI